MTTCPRRMAICVFATAFAILATPWTARAVNYGAILPGETRMGAITPLSQANTFIFDGVASQGVIITMTRILGTSSFEPRIDLYDPDGIQERWSSVWATAQIADYQLKKTGTYTIVCSDWGQDTTGSYALTLTPNPVPMLGTWNSDCGIRQEIEAPNG